MKVGDLVIRTGDGGVRSVPGLVLEIGRTFSQNIVATVMCEGMVRYWYPEYVEVISE